MTTVTVSLTPEQAERLNQLSPQVDEIVRQALEQIAEDLRRQMAAQMAQQSALYHLTAGREYHEFGGRVVVHPPALSPTDPASRESGV